MSFLPFLSLYHFLIIKFWFRNAGSFPTLSFFLLTRFPPQPQPVFDQDAEHAEADGKAHMDKLRLKKEAKLNPPEPETKAETDEQTDNSTIQEEERKQP